jgi:hypothetical protein
VNPYTRWSATLHGLDADQAQLRHDEAHGALYVELGPDGEPSIRIQLTSHAIEDPEQFAATLERDRQGLLRLAEVAAQAAQEIGQRQRDGAL